ncbi:MAG: hypothetical protein HY526_03460 [Betaproteobacteria bacterium]|nr:hypothetical protein [Betaproteobacteria bacterium]
MDRALWITWYDLPEQHRAACLSWVHSVYMPKVLERPGVLWGAHYASEPKSSFTPLGGGGRISHKKDPEGVPTGDRFILMFGATEPHVFANPGAREFHASLPESDREMLRLRIGERGNIMIEEARICGPEARHPDPEMTPGPCIQLGSFNAASCEDEEEMAVWYARWRLPSLKTVPGVIRVRKLVAVAGWAKHACFYEFTSLEARHDHFVYYEKPNPEMVAWSTRVVRDTIHAPGSANVATRIWPEPIDRVERRGG